MTSADRYAGEAEDLLADAVVAPTARIETYCLARAQVYATLAVAAATLHAAYAAREGS